MWTSLRAFFDGQNRQKSKPLRSEYAYLYDAPPADAWVSVDLETTGLNPKKDCALSVGAVRIQKIGGAWQIDCKNALYLVCRPPVMPSKESVVVHGLRPMDVESGLSYERALERLLPFIGNLPLVGFCVEMDKRFLDALALPFLGTRLPNACLDVSLLEQKLTQKRLGGGATIARRKHLNELIDEYTAVRLPAHNALNDALNAAMVFCAVQSRLQKG